MRFVKKKRSKNTVQRGKAKKENGGWWVLTQTGHILPRKTSRGLITVQYKLRMKRFGLTWGRTVDYHWSTFLMLSKIDCFKSQICLRNEPKGHAAFKRDGAVFLLFARLTCLTKKISSLTFVNVSAVCSVKLYRKEKPPEPTPLERKDKNKEKQQFKHTRRKENSERKHIQLWHRIKHCSVHCRQSHIQSSTSW